MQTYYYQFIQIRTFLPNIIMLIAGSSAGSEDFIPPLMEELGEPLVHGITVMPRKPALLAAVDGRPVVGIPPARVAGYGNEEYTHMNVAMAVVSGAADASLGIHAAAQALSLDIIRTDVFREKALAMGGYEVYETRNVVDQI